MQFQGVTKEQYSIEVENAHYIGMSSRELIKTNINFILNKFTDPEWLKQYKLPRSQERKGVIPHYWITEYNGFYYCTVRFAKIRLELDDNASIAARLNNVQEVVDFYRWALNQVDAGFFDKGIAEVQTRRKACRPRNKK